MESYPGVFVSNLSAEAWEPDPDVGGEMHVLCSGHGAESACAGLPRQAMLLGRRHVGMRACNDRPTEQGESRGAIIEKVIANS
jgi:hypothetical protein